MSTNRGHRGQGKKVKVTKVQVKKSRSIISRPQRSRQKKGIGHRLRVRYRLRDTG